MTDFENNSSNILHFRKISKFGHGETYVVSPFRKSTIVQTEFGCRQRIYTITFLYQNHAC